MSPNSRSSGVVFSSHFGMPEAESGSARIEHIGDKAAGLLRLPEAWTLPFFVLPTTVHDALLPKDGSSPITDPQIVFSGLRRELVTWLSVITEKGRYGLIFRSSAAGETLAERGRYLSLAKKPKQNYGEFCRSVLDIVEQAATQSPGVRTAVIVQRYLRMDILGHLSNETHLMPTRDRWAVEYSWFFDVSNGIEEVSERGGDQVDHGDVGGGVSVSACLCPSGLEETVEALHAGVAVA